MISPRSPLAVIAALATTIAAPAQVGPTVRVSLTPSGAQTVQFYDSSTPVISRDGRFVAFRSEDATLVPGDTNDRQDVFVRELATGVVERVNVSTTGVQANGHSEQPRISGDGRYVAFHTQSSTLQAGYNGVFVRDRLLGTTACASVGFDGAPLDTGGSGLAYQISPDGRFLVFSTRATNAAPGVDGNGTVEDVYLRDLFAGVSERISVTTGGAQGSEQSTAPAVTPDGRYVVFMSVAQLDPPESNGNVGDVYLRDRVLQTTRLISSSSTGVLPNQPSFYPTISDDGRMVAFESWSSLLVPGDTNAFADVFVKDVIGGTLVCASVASGTTGPPLGGATSRISADGRFVSFQSGSALVVPGDTNQKNDVFVRDMRTRAVTRVHVGGGGVEANENVYAHDLQSDGTAVVFESLATNLVAGDTNAARDVFLHRRPGADGTAYCAAKTDSVGCVPTFQATGVPSVGAGQGFDVALLSVRSNTVGLLFYGLAPQNVPFQGGWRCVSGSLRRTPNQLTGGPSAPLDCSGAFTFDFAAHAASGVDGALVPGTTVYAQYDYRDPLDPSGFARGSSGGFAFTLVP